MLSVELRLFVVVVVYTWSAKVTERDSHQTAQCTAETAEHLESRRSAERSRSRRRPSVRVVKRLSRRRLDCLQTSIGHNFVGMPKPQSSLPRDGRTDNGRRSVTAGNVSDSS